MSAYTTSYGAAHRSPAPPPGVSSSGGIARYGGFSSASPNVDEIRKWKAQAIEREREKAARRQKAGGAGASSLPSLGSSGSAPERVAARASAHHRVAAAREHARLPGEGGGAHARGSDMMGAARRRRQQAAATSSSSYGSGLTSSSSYGASATTSAEYGGSRRGHERASGSRSYAPAPAPVPAPAPTPAPTPVCPPARKSGSAAPERRTLVPSSSDKKDGKLCCDACDGPHLTAECPLYKGKARDKHKDGQKGKPKDIGSGTGGNFTLTKAKEVRMPPDGRCGPFPALARPVPLMLATF